MHKSSCTKTQIVQSAMECGTVSPWLHLILPYDLPKAYNQKRSNPARTDCAKAVKHGKRAAPLGTKKDISYDHRGNCE